MRVNRQINKAVLFLLVMIVVTAGITSQAYALDMDYYTYGGFDAVAGAIQKVALIFSDNEYKGLFFTVIVLGIFFGASSVYYKIATGMRISPLAWAWPIGIGVLVYLSLIVPKGTLTVYDTTTGRFQTIANVPEGIVAIAGTLNLIERGMIEIVDTSGTPASYRSYAGGLGFNTLYVATNTEIMMPDQYMDQTLRRYVNDCLFFELMRPGTSLSVNSLTIDNTDFVPLFALARNPAVYTVVYSESIKTGVPKTCTDAWDQDIEPFLTDASNFDRAIEYTCANAGFKKDYPLEINKCKQAIEDTVQYVSGGTITINAWNYLRQVFMAQALNDVVLSNNPDLALRATASRNIMTSGIGVGITANEWLPVIRAVMTAVVITLIPFIAIFIPTPLVGRAIALIAGFFVWLAAWGVTDAIAHGIATDYAYNALEYIRQRQLGLAAIMHNPDYTMKALAMFGMVRTFGIMLATVITMMMLRFGGHALAMMAGNLSGMVQSHGSQAAMKTQTPEGQASTLNSLEVVPPVMANAHRFDFNARTQAKTFEKASGTEGSLKTMSSIGGGPFGAASQMGHKMSVQNTEAVNWAKQLTPQQASMLGLGRGTIDRIKADTLTPEDYQQIGRVKVLGEKYSAWQNGAQRLVDGGYVKDLEEGMNMAKQLDSASVVGRYLTMKELSGSRLAKSLRMSKEKLGEFQNNLLNNNFDDISKDPVQLAGLAKLAGKGSEEVSSADMKRGRNLIGGLSDWYLEQAGVDMSRVLPDKHAADLRGFSNFQDLTGYEGSYQDYMSALQDVEKVKTYSDRKLYDSAMEGIANKYFDGDKVMAYKAAANYHNQEIAGILEKASELGITGGELGKLKGHVNALQTMANAAKISRVGDDNYIRTEADKASNELAKFDLLRAAALKDFDRDGSETVDDPEFQRFLEAHHGANITYSSDNGVETVSMTQEGRVLFRGQRGVTTVDNIDTIRRETRAAGFKNVVSKAEPGMEFEKVYDEDNRLVGVKLMREGNVVVSDFTKKSTGRKDETLAINISKFGRGTMISSDSMLSAVIEKDGSLAERITGAWTAPAREREEVLQAQKMAEGLSEMVNRTGKTVSYSEVDGKGTLRVGTPGEGVLGFGVGATASVGLGRQNREEQNYDLYYGMVRRIQGEARKKATIDGDFNEDRYKELYINALNNLYKGTDSLAKGKTEFSFGVSGVVGEPFEEAKAMVDRIRGE